MSRILRSFVAGAVTSALLLASAAPALADTVTMNGNNEQSHTVPVLLDALFLRPVGMVVTAFGAVTFCAIAPIMAITRPTDIGKPFRSLVMGPARYTWVDPLGYH
jgi:ABC-type transport system involved in cytochrome c biogenesis permease subunit